MSLSSITQKIFYTSKLYRPAICTIKGYSRWAHRKPAKVLLPLNAPTSLKSEKVIDLGSKLHNHEDVKETNIVSEIQIKKKNSTNYSQIEQSESTTNSVTTNFKDVKIKRKEKNLSTKAAINRLSVFDDNDEIIYEKCKDNDGRISNLLVKLKSRKDRLKSGQVLVEGWRLIVDGLEAKCKLKYVIFSSKNDLVHITSYLPKSGVKLFKIPYKEIKLWSDVETPPGIFGIFEQPTPENIKRFSNPFPVQIVCDNIRVPGNLGSIMRVAAGAGCQRLLLTKGCVDLWDPKVVRSAAGAHFRIPVLSGITWDHIEDYVHDVSSVFIADSSTVVSDDSETAHQEDGSHLPLLPYYGVDYASQKFITIIIGGETEGISEECYRYATMKNGLRVHIPLQKGVDSLNTGTAAAIIAFEVKKQLLLAYTRASRDKGVVYGT